MPLGAGTPAREDPTGGCCGSTGRARTQAGPNQETVLYSDCEPLQSHWDSESGGEGSGENQRAWAIQHAEPIGFPGALHWGQGLRL